MHVTIVTAFPEFFGDFLSTSILGRAVKRGLVRVDLVDLREFGRGGYRQIDDYAFGSGGMVLAAPPLADALRAAGELGEGDPFVVYPSPQGCVLTQEIVESLTRQEHVVILCGHYEGLDERFVEREVDLEVTVGDCVLTGGEIPAMAIVDAMTRLVPGVVGRGEAVAEDSFYRGMLDHPHYTRPASWEGQTVPEVLLGGNASEIHSWRRAKAVERTLARRPDLLSRAAIRGYLTGNVYLAVMGDAEVFPPPFVSDVRRLCRTYGLGRPVFVVTDREGRRSLESAAGAEGDPVLSPKIFGSLEWAIDWIERKEKGAPLLRIAVLDAACRGSLHALEVKRRCLEHPGPVLLLFPVLPEEWRGLEGGFLVAGLFDGGETLPLTARAAVALDRILGGR